jgi:arylsulfatase A-like enzyme
MTRCLFSLLATIFPLLASAEKPPNILVLIADDWSWPHAGALGDPVVKTPTFDRLMKEGVHFKHAFVSSPSCSPSRFAIASGQYHWRLESGQDLGGSLPKNTPGFSELLEHAGYQIGFSRKGAQPSKHAHTGRDPFGKRFKSFPEFFTEKKEGQPFCFWYGAGEPHRPYLAGTGEKAGLDPAKVVVPPGLPDNGTIREDLCDYLERVQRFDRDAGRILKLLENMGELENTIVVMTSDNGMPFPRCKATLYDMGTRVPLVIRWGAEVKGGRNIDDFVSLTDLAPSFLEAAGLPIPAVMTGRTLLPILRSEKSGQVEPTRTHVIMGMEQHVFPNPSRAIRTADFLYIRNFEPGKWKTGRGDGNPPAYDFSKRDWPRGAEAFSYNIDPSPTKQWMLQHPDDPASKLCFSPRPEEELYDLRKDPGQLHNVAADKDHQTQRAWHRELLEAQLVASDDPRMGVRGYESHSIEGWRVLISQELFEKNRENTAKALAILKEQLVDLPKRVPPQAVHHLRKIPLWFSPVYPEFGSRAEYHPDRSWLVENKRNPLMAKGVEFSMVDEMAEEIRRMPLLTLHELAHGYHDQIFGFDGPAIKAAFERARDSKTYEAVKRTRGIPGQSYTTEKAYAMTNQMEYFAEVSEAYFGRNDWYPFNYIELKSHDPKALPILEAAWGGEPLRKHLEVTAVPTALKADPFYTKFVDAYGLPVLSSEKVSDYALREAGFLITEMLVLRPDVLKAMIESGSQLRIMAHNEYTTDLPGWDHLVPKDYRDARARGMGGSLRDPLCSCAEENLLGYPGDPYSDESIVIHELAHNIHLRGVVRVDPTFDRRLEKTYEAAMKKWLWAGKYASVNHYEYFAEGVQSWFDNNRPPDHDHNHVDTRVELIEYDPALAALCKEVFGETELKYTKPTTRLHGHLGGYDPTTAPTFKWPERLKKAQAEIRRKALERGRKAREKKK